MTLNDDQFSSTLVIFSQILQNIFSKSRYDKIRLSLTVLAVPNGPSQASLKIPNKGKVARSNNKNIKAMIKQI